MTMKVLSYQDIRRSRSFTFQGTFLPPYTKRFLETVVSSLTKIPCFSVMGDFGGKCVLCCFLGRLFVP